MIISKSRLMSLLFMWHHNADLRNHMLALQKKTYRCRSSEGKRRSRGGGMSGQGGTLSGQFFPGPRRCRRPGNSGGHCMQGGTRASQRSPATLGSDRIRF